LRKLSAETGMQVVIVRPPLVYAADAPGNFGRLLKLVRWGFPLPLSLVRNQRSFIARENLLDFIIICIDHPMAANQTFVVADGEDLSTPALIRLLAAGMGRPARLFPAPVSLLGAGAALLGRESVYQQLCGSLQVNISKARSLLQWSPPVRVADALYKAAQDFVKYRQ
jgi:nucleoside-diphosphate-sugar epimerase